jgi:hypothetical protein
MSGGQRTMLGGYRNREVPAEIRRLRGWISELESGQ